ncbi:MULTISPECIES: GNAT family N-acetyltransferase [unclassified Agrobacterium]|uniref:GNAT family N-acetyltransferase n=1 Tax=unclassified Agrobacterium TaxID=2632611 RepID=UPI00069C9019|nr:MULTISPECIES: GNAT family N-acetyltransferase [unclassified Agrobacterium]KNY33229.1 acetyltransferase [Agrobacterium sp. SUL3]MCD4659511.1 GNAT family N-acetyltransferase [Agrobacterium sp.]
MILISAATDDDIEWLLREDKWIGEDWLRRCVGHREYLVAKEDTILVGFLRFSMFWGKIPYMDMIRVIPEFRGHGVGATLTVFWETLMREQGASLVMTSSQQDEQEPQTWHRRNGYKEAGILNLPKIQDAAEVFFTKALC